MSEIDRGEIGTWINYRRDDQDMFGDRYSNRLPERARVTATDFDAERAYDDDRFSAREVFHSDRLKVICGYFEPGQFIPVHAPSSDLALTVQSGTGTVRDGDTNRSIEPGNVVVVEAETARGIKADGDTRLEVLLVTAPPPTDAEHEPVREGLRRGQFDPRGDDA